MNGAMAGGLSAVLLGMIMKLARFKNHLLDIPMFCSGVLGGLVAITAPADVIETWEALIIGFTGGLVANGGKILALNLIKSV